MQREKVETNKRQRDERKYILVSLKKKQVKALEIYKITKQNKQPRDMARLKKANRRSKGGNGSSVKDQGSAHCK